MQGRTEKQLVNTMINACVDRREECGAVWNAYRKWSDTPSADARLAFAAYQAALDRERQAADLCADLTQRVAERVKERGDPHSKVSSSRWRRIWA
jgi:hypothetical protein